MAGEKFDKTYKQTVCKPLVGGLEASMPPHMLGPSQSPDLLNVVLNNNGIEKRGGFVPLVKEQPYLSSIKNRGHHARGRIQNTGSAADSNIVIVPGAAYAGHRPIYESLNIACAVEMFVRVSDLTTEHVGNQSTTGGGNVYYTANDATPYTIRVRPIFSKGPAKRFYDQDATYGPAEPVGATSKIQWRLPTSPGGVSYWAPGIIEAGMPWCIYLFNNAGSWEFRVSFHSIITATGQFELLTMRIPTTSLVVGTDVTYHVVFSIQHGLGAVFRVGVVQDRNSQPAYYTSTSILNAAGAPVTFTDYRAPSGFTRGPVQLFDCPQEFIEAPTAVSTARPPGLAYSAAGDGGYWFAAKRFEGSVEDIVIWSTHKLGVSQTALDRAIKLDLAAQSQQDVASYWSMAERGRQFVKEMTGRGNHLYFLPAGPVFDDTLGSPRSSRKACWWFNGQTSYAQPDLDARAALTVADVDAGINAYDYDGIPNWRYRFTRPPSGAAVYASEVAFYQKMVLGNYGHGLEVTFWPDAIETRFEQVIMEIHGVLRLAIDVDGTLVGYCRNDANGAGLTYLYQATGGGVGHNHLATTYTVEVGRRYTVQLYRVNGGTTLQMWVNGALVGSTTVVASNADGWLVSGITMGMGSYQLNGYTDNTAGQYPLVGSPPTPNEVNIDPRSGFMGRIESARLLAGEAGAAVPNYKDEGYDDYQVTQKALWNTPSPASATVIRLEAESGEELSANMGPGHGLVTANKNYPYIDKYFLPREIHGIYGNTNTNSQYGVTPAVAQVQDFGFARDAGGSGTTETGFNVLHGGVKSFFTIARFVFDIDDGETAYAGAYKNQMHAWFNGTTPTLDSFRSIHVQLSSVKDEVGTLSAVLKCCTESDHISLIYRGTGFGIPFTSLRHSGRPYHFKSPRELAPTWGEGIVRPLTGTNRISLLADWQHQQSGENFLVTACARQLYWVKSAWRGESPFDEEQPHSVWGFGRPDDHIKFNNVNGGANFSKSGANFSTITFDAWVYPQRLDGNRAIATNGVVASARCNWFIGTIDGSLCVFGGADGNTKTWIYREGSYPAATLLPRVTLKANSWNHIYVLIGSCTATGAASATVQCWVNGIKVTMTAVPGADAITAGVPDAGNYPVFLMGLPEYLRTVILTGAVGWANAWQSWHGMMTEARIGNVEEASFFSGASFGYPPRARYTSVVGYYLMHLNEGVGWSVANTAASAAGIDDGTIHMRELVLIDENAEALDDSSDATYDQVVFRDELLVTNGFSNPQRVRFTSFSDPLGPFRRYRIGMEAPFVAGSQMIPFAFASTPDPNPLNSYAATAAYDVYVAFVNDDFEESNPTFVARYIKPTADAATEYAGFRINHIPRSPDPQVTRRRIYISANGGGDSIAHSYVEDNVSYDAQVYDQPLGDAVDIGARTPAPRARHITVGSGTVFLGYLTESASGSNAFAFSDGATISYFPVVNQLIVDSTNGKAITGFRAHLGRLYIFKRDSTWQFALQGTGNPTEAGAYLSPISESIGLPGGLVSFDNLLYGTGERGPYAFDGANHVYLGKALKDDYQTFALTDQSLLAIDGAFERPNSQYWISMRQVGKDYNEYAYVLHTAVGDQQSWTKLQLPKHTVMGGLLLPDTQSQAIVIGTIHGQILRYTTDTYIDGHGDTKQDDHLTTLSGSISSGTTTSALVILPAGQTLDTIANGLRGCTITVNGVTRVIERTDGATIYWREPLLAVAAGTFLIGAYSSYWTSPWMDPQSYGAWIETKFIDIDHAPTSVSITVDNHVANAVSTDRAFPASPETRNAVLSTGYLTQPLPTVTKNHGRYYRVRFSSNSHKDRWLITGWAMRWSESGIRGQPT